MKTRIYAALLVAGLACLAAAAWTPHVQAQRSGSMRQAWEYRVVVNPIYVKVSKEPLTQNSSDDERAQAGQAAFNQLGAEGWELVTFGERYITFKRPK